MGCGGGAGMDWEFGINRCKLLHIEWMNNKVLLYSTGNYIEYAIINHNEKEKKLGCFRLFLILEKGIYCFELLVLELLLLHPIHFGVFLFHFHLSQGICLCIFLFLLCPIGCSVACC